MAKRKGNWSKDEGRRMDKAIRKGLLSYKVISKAVHSRTPAQVKSHLQKVKDGFKKLAHASAGRSGPCNIYNSYLYYLSCLPVTPIENEEGDHSNTPEQIEEPERFEVDEEYETNGYLAGDGLEYMCTSATTNSFL